MTPEVTVLFPREEIRHRVDELGALLTEDYADNVPVLISVLKGGSIFLADLVRRIHAALRVEFMSISAYGGASGPSGVVRILKDLDRDIGGEDVLIVEDIVDTGLTLSYLISPLRSRQPRSIQVCTLLDKSVRRIAPLDLRYVGFDCPDRFVVGYGLDHEERYRNLPDIVAVDPATIAENPDLLVPYLAGAAPSPAEEQVVGPEGTGYSPPLSP
jgi:hypoxanthine phosphoribosyltransferase